MRHDGGSRRERSPGGAKRKQMQVARERREGGRNLEIIAELKIKGSWRIPFK